MARLIEWVPRVASIALVNGPASSGSGSNTLADGSEQSFSGAHFALSFDMAFAPASNARARAEHGWLLAMQNGANAAKYEYLDQMRKTPAELGEPSQAAWASPGAWSSGGAWGGGSGTVALTEDAELGATTVALADSKWGHALETGDCIGFTSYYGAHWVTEIIAEGTYRITPPLRNDLTVSRNRVHMTPRLALRQAPGSASYGTFNPAYSDGRGGRFIEVFDEYISTYFRD